MAGFLVLLALFIEMIFDCLFTLICWGIALYVSGVDVSASKSDFHETTVNKLPLHETLFYSFPQNDGYSFILLVIVSPLNRGLFLLCWSCAYRFLSICSDFQKMQIVAPHLWKCSLHKILLQCHQFCAHMRACNHLCCCLEERGFEGVRKNKWWKKARERLMLCESL